MSKQKKKKKNPGRATVPPLLPKIYERYYQALIGGEDAGTAGNTVHWDCGKGERPHIVAAHFRQVARKEGIDVSITLEGQSLLLKFPKREQKIRVKRDNATVAEAEKVYS